MNFDSIIGQDDIINNLKKGMIEDTILHAYIFSGPKGCGKRTLARILAGNLLCESKVLGERCNKCNICKMYNGDTLPDCLFISNNNRSISVDEVRAIQAHTSIRPLYSTRKIYIIEDAEKMTLQAQNCLLKLLEEPPSYVVIILTTSKYDSIIETIRSRAVRQKFRLNTQNEIKEFLKKRNQSHNSDIDFISAYADGVIGKAIELVEDKEFSSIRDNTFKIIEEILYSNKFDISKISNYFEDNKLNYKTILDIMELIFRDILITKYDNLENMLINFDKRDIMFKVGKSVTVSKALKDIEIIENTKQQLDKNTNYGLTIDVMIMKLREE